MSDFTKNEYHKVIGFENGYALSIISHEYSYGGKDGLFEVALLDMNKNIIYDEALGFKDVIGFLDFTEVAEIIEQIKSVSK